MFSESHESRLVCELVNSQNVVDISVCVCVWELHVSRGDIWRNNYNNYISYEQ